MASTIASVDKQDHLTALHVCDGAAAVLRRVRAEAEDADYPPDRTRSAGDRQSQHVIAAMLGHLCSDDPILSEEALDDPRRLASRRVWIVDPLDGTREFAEAGRSDWAVHVALAVDGVPVAAAVALPALGVTYSTHEAPPQPQPRQGRLRIVASRTRPPAFVASLAEQLDAELVPMGSAGAKTMAVIAGDADLYVHGGGQYEWDSAAPVAVARAAGLHTSRLDGSELRYNQPRPWLPDQLVCRPELAERVLAELRRWLSPNVSQSTER